MSQAQPPTAAPLPDQLAAEVDRERMLRQGTLASFHTWWARRPTVLARIATYLAITEQQSPNAEFLAALGAVTPSAVALSEACVRVRDAAWGWSVRETARTTAGETETITTPGGPRLLDPFAGGGSIPVEASRLGCSVSAGDLSPVAHHILRCLLEFAPTYAAPDRLEKGSGDDGAWAGLAEELQHWAGRVEALVGPKVSGLFPVPQGFEATPPDRYLWFRSANCPNPSCGATVPLQTEAGVATGQREGTLRFGWSSGQPVPVLANDPASPQDRSRWVCLSCRTSVDLRAVPANPLPGILAAVRVRGTGRPTVRAVLPAEMHLLAPWERGCQERLDELLGSDFATAVHQSLEGNWQQALIRHGGASFRDLFSPRQLLVALEYVRGVREVAGEMGQAGIAAPRVEALQHYLAFLVDYLVERNSILCGWAGTRLEATTSFARHTPVFNRVYVERAPTGLVQEWLARTCPVIEEMANIRRAETVYLGDACQLPFKSDHFDAVVTEPPYYDNVAYGELSQFFAVWESAVLARPTPASAGEYVEARRGEEPELYRQRVLCAFREIYRVLKPGRKCCLFFSGAQADAFQNYVELCQQAGLELFDVRSLPETARVLGGDAERLTCLIYLRKPAAEPTRQPLQARADSSLVEAVLSGKRVMYGALAEMIIRELPPEDLKDLLPQGGKGTTLEQVMEVIAAPEEDPRELLERCFGKAGIRRIAQGLNTDTSTRVGSPMELLLTHYGFSLPSPAAQIDGPAQVRERLKRMMNRIHLAPTPTDTFGPFLEGTNAVERLLRVAIWGWLGLLFGEERDAHLTAILQGPGGKRKYDLDRLTFGNIVSLFRGLPDHIAQSTCGSRIEEKFGRRQLYLPDVGANSYVDRLSAIVAVRNKVEHNKDNYRDETPLPVLRQDLASTLETGYVLLGKLVEEHAVPRVAEPYQEMRDKYNRLTYRLSLDDGTDAEVRFSAPLLLGTSYLYFGTGTNPKPVDPLVLAAGKLGKVP